MEAQHTDEGGKARRKPVWIIGLIALLLVAGAAALYYVHDRNQKSAVQQQAEAERQSILTSQVFRDGVVVGGVSLGGMTMEQAKAAVTQAEQAQLTAVSFKLTLDSNSYPVTAQDLGLSFDVDAVLKEAFALARQGTLEQLKAELADIKANQRKFDVAEAPGDAAVSAFAATLSQKLDKPAVDAEFKVLVDKSASDEVKKTSAYVEAAATTTPEQRFAYVPDQDGRVVDQQALKDALLAMVKSGTYKDMELPVKAEKAGVTLGDLQKKIVLRSSSFTSFGHSPYNRATRVFNLKKAVGILNGTVVQPGEVFSYNQTIGNRTYAGGWKPAPAIVGGRHEDQAGGGVCQISTTMYLSVLKSDLEIVSRQGHSERLSYAPGGLDATVDSGRIDFQWKNATSSPIYIFCWIDVQDKTIHFEFYGEPFPQDFDEIQLSSKHVGSLSPSGPMEYIVDPTLPVGVYIKRHSGSVWQSYATYMKNGVAVKTVDVDRTVYKAYAGVTVMAASEPSPAVSAPVTVPVP